MAQKTNSGVGTIFKRGKKWRGQITLGCIRKSFSGDTKGEVASKIAMYKADFERGQLDGNTDMTVKELFDIWIKRVMSKKLAEQSLDKLVMNMQNHMIPTFGHIKVSELTRSMLEEGYAKIFQTKSDKNYKQKQYSHSTVKQISSNFKKMLQFAVLEGVINKNPHEGVELHKLRPPKKVMAYTLDEHKKILEYTLNNGQLYWIYWLLISTGMRFGEAVALTWDDVDFKAHTICINKTFVELHGSPIIQNKTKTDAGVRTIHISDSQIKVLKGFKDSYDKELNYRNLVVPNTRYGIVTSANTRRRWQRVCAELDIHYHGIHALRHTWATRALEASAPVKTVSAMLGHKNVITTMNIYQDVFKESQEIVLDCMSDLLE